MRPCLRGGRVKATVEEVRAGAEGAAEPRQGAGGWRGHVSVCRRPGCRSTNPCQIASRVECEDASSRGGGGQACARMRGVGVMYVFVNV